MKSIVTMLMVALVISIACSPVVWAADAQKAPANEIKDRPIQVLFCGNSYTSIGRGLPDALSEIANQKNSKLKIEWDRWTVSGSTLAKRWKMNKEERAESLSKHDKANPKYREQKSTLPETIENGKYDLVILQQHSRGQNISGEAKPIVKAAKAAKAKVAFMQTWSSSKEKGPAFPQQEKLNQGYEKARKEFGAGLIPCGQLWQEIKTALPKLKIYRDPGHPSNLGHHVNALLFYVWLTGHDVRELPSMARKEFTKEDESTVRDLVMKVYEESASYPGK